MSSLNQPKSTSSAREVLLEQLEGRVCRAFESGHQADNRLHRMCIMHAASHACKSGPKIKG
jgi:hypothetical protein